MLQLTSLEVVLSYMIFYRAGAWALLQKFSWLDDFLYSQFVANNLKQLIFDLSVFPHFEMVSVICWDQYCSFDLHQSYTGHLGQPADFFWLI